MRVMARGSVTDGYVGGRYRLGRCAVLTLGAGLGILLLYNQLSS